MRLFIVFLLSGLALAVDRAHAQPTDQAEPTASPAPASPENQDLSLSLREDLGRFNWLGAGRDIWYAELFHAGGNPIRLNQLVIALLVIAIGLWVSRQVAQRVGRRVSKVKRVDANFAAAIQKIVFYALCVVVFFTALPIAGIPMAIFTVLGGGVALGIGLGAQNLFNNLISGLILMFERPIRLGDIVVAGEQEGRVEDIGNRCTRIRRFDGIDVLVPNSSLLQQPVVNWTLKDANIRGSVTVGVAYGSPVEQVRDLIGKAAAEHPRILREPPPEVLFTDFADNTLNFEVYFWANVTRPLDLRRIQSDLRFHIDQLFHEAGIVIAFPQRDVHLDTLRPLEVRMLQSPAPASGSPSGSSPGTAPDARPGSPAEPRHEA
ncbi:MAG: mechanosensitive ion channel domain-containing protein [Planctomycetota bacterium]